MRAYLVGSGLASLAAAVYLIKDGGLSGSDITIYEARTAVGGSLRLGGSWEKGFVFPGARVFEKQYRCALELFSLIPSRSDPSKSIKDEILEFNKDFGWDNKSRLIDSDGRVVRSPGLRLRHVAGLIRLLLTTERLLDGKPIKECVPDDFFDTNFWYAWSSIMAFLPEHSAIEMRRYMLRFFHLLSDLWRERLIFRTKYHQQQAIVDPIVAWLRKRNVSFVTNAVVTNVLFVSGPQGTITANGLQLVVNGQETTLKIASNDVVMVTNGSQVAHYSIGSMTEPPVPNYDAASAPEWALWSSIAQGRPDFGQPNTFTGDLGRSKWVSFTITSTHPRFEDPVRAITGREPGRGGLISFKRSNWLITIVVFHQPELIDQPPGTFLSWGYGMYPDRPGNFVQKPMTECTGSELLEELVGHLRLDAHQNEILATSICIPCLIPYASSVCLLRKITDRPQVMPKGSTNFAFVGQFCEQPEDVVFTMEYSVRSARTAVCELLHTGRKPPPVYKGYLNPKVLLRTAGTLLSSA